MNWIKRTVFYLTCLIFCAGAIGILTSDIEGTHHLLWAKWLIGVSGLLFFGGGALCMAYKDIQVHLRHREGVEFTNEGMCIRKKTFIEWQKIKGFSLWHYQGTDIILVNTRNPLQDIADEPNPIRRVSMRLSYKISGAIYSFSSLLMEGTPEEVLQHCKDELRKHQPSTGYLSL